MEIRIQYYGMLAEITGQATEQLTLEAGLTVGMLRERVSEKYPEMGNKKFKVAVNLQIVDDLVEINADSEIALLPPFAGG
jgi:molybdopterin synthase sulfur carrier subunit